LLKLQTKTGNQAEQLALLQATFTQQPQQG